ncbi:MAG: recombination mediator RecR [Bifidobacteriaceae bacterium]|nr:recombination mediator RecR [Bifidobacteriaceae bacterium]
MVFSGALQDLVDELASLPGVGPKGASRIAFHILNAPAEDVERLVGALGAVKEKVRLCERCFNIAEQPLCAVCQDPRRDQAVICVVSEPKDVIAIERTREYRGLYHVLGGAISPIRGIGPDDLHIRELLARLGAEPVGEVIVATDPNIEGEATATYLARALRALEIPVTRLASGLPVGGDLEYADEVTLSRALEGRRSL